VICATSLGNDNHVLANAAQDCGVAADISDPFLFRSAGLAVSASVFQSERNGTKK
jgi:hypothetical protein